MPPCAVPVNLSLHVSTATHLKQSVVSGGLLHGRDEDLGGPVHLLTY
jgi:hypothetical protein